jgi:intein-encoded DNA endonuclease-like protein
MGYLYKYNSDIFLSENDISYYLLGLFITDGNVYIKKNATAIQCEIKSIDYDFLITIKNLICPNLPLKKSHNNCFRLRINNKEIGQWLILNKCIPNKTKVVDFPDIPKEYLSDFVRGLIDGDGSIGIYKNRSCVRFDSASLNLITKLCYLLNNLNIKCSISKSKWIECILNGRKIKSTTQMYRLTFTGLTAYKLLKFIYKNERLCLLRKKETAELIYNYIERNGFTEEELLNMNRLPVKKWLSDNDLFKLMINHNGILKSAAQTIGVSSWGLSCRLREIGMYDAVRQLYPINNIKNLKPLTAAI